MHLTPFEIQHLKKFTILSAWKKVGLIPFNPSVVLNQLLKPRSHLEEWATPSPHPDEEIEVIFSTPRTFQALKEVSYNIESVYPKR